MTELHEGKPAARHGGFELGDQIVAVDGVHVPPNELLSGRISPTMLTIRLLLVRRAVGRSRCNSNPSSNSSVTSAAAAADGAPFSPSNLRVRASSLDEVCNGV